VLVRRRCRGPLLRSRQLLGTSSVDESSDVRPRLQAAFLWAEAALLASSHTLVTTVGSVASNRVTTCFRRRKDSRGPETRPLAPTNCCPGRQQPFARRRTRSFQPCSALHRTVGRCPSAVGRAQEARRCGLSCRTSCGLAVKQHSLRADGALHASSNALIPMVCSTAYDGGRTPIRREPRVRRREQCVRRRGQCSRRREQDARRRG
jgi:hypothetical protein